MDGGIEERQHAVAKRLGFEISDHSLILYGHCRKPNCPNQKRAEAERSQASRRLSAARPVRASSSVRASLRPRGVRQHFARMRARLLGDVDAARHARDFVDALGGAKRLHRRAGDLAVGELGDPELARAPERRPAPNASRTAPGARSPSSRSLPADDLGHRAADAGIDLVEHHGQRAGCAAGGGLAPRG